MKIQEIFTEYIELKAYLVDHKIVFLNTTLYNNYIKPIYGNKEISTLNLIDYQNFANNLLSGTYKYQQMSRDRIEQIMDVLIDIYRFAIKSNYYQGDNLPQLIELKFDSNRDQVWKRDMQDLTLAIELGESFVSLFKNMKKMQLAQSA